MTYVEHDIELSTHPKLLRMSISLAPHLDLPLAFPVDVSAIAEGLVTRLWCWSMKYADGGDLSPYEPIEVALGIGWKGDPDVLFTALVAARFLESDRTTIHDWEDYAGKLVRRRQKNAARMRTMRDAYADGTIAAVRERDGDTCRYCGVSVVWTDKRGPTGGTYDHIIPGCESTIENLVVCCRSCNSRKGHRTPEQADMRLDSGPYQVIPNTDLTRTCSRNGTERTKRNGTELTRMSPSFGEYWSAYPKKTEVKTARSRWAKLSDQQRSEVLAAAGVVADAVCSGKVDVKYVPGGAVFLNERWPEWLHGIPDHYRSNGNGAKPDATFAALREAYQRGHEGET